MKKFIAALMCLMMLLSLFSCNNESIENENIENIDDNSNNDSNITSDTSTDPITNTTSANYDSVLEVYRRIVDSYPIVNQNPRALAAELGIQGEEDTQFFIELYSTVMVFYPGRGEADRESPHYKLGCGYSVKDLNGDGVDELVLLNDEYYIMAIFSYADGKPVLLGNYWERSSCWIDGDGLLHNNGSNGAMNFLHRIYEIKQGSSALKLLVEYGADDIEFPNTYYYQLVNDKKVSITKSEYNALDEQYGKYLGSVAGAEATKKYSGLTFTSLYTEAEIAMDMYETVLNNEIKVYETNTKEYSYLADCRTPYNMIPLRDCTQLGYAYTDIDGDAIKELIIDCGDTLILHYYEGTVYLYPFTFRQLYYLNTDGSHSWNHTGSDFEYGERKIYFEGAELKTKELWRIVNDGEPNAEYYIDGNQVSDGEILKYFEDNPKTKIEFSPLAVSW